MEKNRLEAFSDGVLAIIITIMVLELKVPHTAALSALFALWPVLGSYLLSFFYVGIYWNNHHHLMQAANKVNGAVLWANLHLLFWLSLLPFATGWMGENDFERWPVTFYGVDLLLAAVAFTILQNRLARISGNKDTVARALRHDRKSWISTFLYGAGIVCAQTLPAWTGMVFYAAVALFWVVPDRRMERVVVSDAESETELGIVP